MAVRTLTHHQPDPPDRLPAPTLVQDADALERALEALQGHEEIAVDTEADSFFSYQEKVCLIQVTAGRSDFLIDPLQDLDLSGFGDVLADPAVTKVFHDGEYDVLILKRDYGFSFAGLFDTRIAAAALGNNSPGLASVLKEHYGIELDKSLQRSNWSARPLTREQIAYARLDTHYLVPLMRDMGPALDEADRRKIVDGECRRLEALVSPDRSFNPDEFIRLKGARGLDPRQMRILKELYAGRDRMARRRDVPPFKVLSHRVLVEIAMVGPRDVEALATVPGMTHRSARRFGEFVLRAVERGRELGPLKRIPTLASRDGTSSLDDAGRELHERLKDWRRRRATEEELDSSLVLNRHVLLRLAAARPEGRRDLAKVDGLLSWQIELFGAELLELVRTFESGRGVARSSRRRRRRR